MTIKKKEVEVEYPDCDICGRCIEEDEVYCYLNIEEYLAVTRGTQGKYGYAVKLQGHKEDDIYVTFCKQCAMERRDVVLQRLLRVHEKIFNTMDWDYFQRKEDEEETT